MNETKPRFHRSSRYLLWGTLVMALLCIAHVLPTWCFGWTGVFAMIWISQVD